MPKQKQERLVTVAKYANDFDANVALTKLKSMGIRCILNGEGTANVWGGALGVTFTPIRLMVLSDDADAAIEILKENEDGI